MDFILDAVSSAANAMAAVLGGWSWTRNLAADFAVISEYVTKANRWVPIGTALTVLGLWVTLNLILIGYYWITRTINLLRGAG